MWAARRLVNVGRHVCRRLPSHRPVGLWGLRGVHRDVEVEESDEKYARDVIKARSPIPVVYVDLTDFAVPYDIGWSFQQAYNKRRLADCRERLTNPQPSDTSVPQCNDTGYLDMVVVCTHPPVYTLGRRTAPSDLRFPVDNPPEGFTCVRCDRGGRVTYHGPGQLVVYPLLDLRRYKEDLHWYVRQCERVVISALNEEFDIQCSTEDDHTGVWTADKSHKLAAIGINCSRWFTSHGLALNVDPRLRDFDAIVPCGISEEGRHVGSIAQLLGSDAQLYTRAKHAMRVRVEELFGVIMDDSRGDAVAAYLREKMQNGTLCSDQDSVFDVLMK